MLSDTAVQRALVVHAHPDDVDFSAAGTMARWTDGGIDVTYLIVTDGDAGGSDRSVPRGDMPTIRRAEQREAAKCVGVDDVRFLGYPDGRVAPTLDLRRDIARVIRQVRPQRMLVPSPERSFERMGASHPDHRAVGDAALDAIYPDARNPFAHPELLEQDDLEPWKVPETWLTSAGGRANRYVDVTDTFERKVAALRAHVSQTGHMDDLEERLRGWLERNAVAGGLGPDRLAEAFYVMETG